MRWPCTLLFSIVYASAAQAAPVSATNRALSDCGSMYVPPFGDAGDVRARPCDAAGVRHYQPRHHGTAFEVLDLESQACFVPDEAYQLLDTIFDTIDARVRAEGLETSAPSRRTALRVSAITGDVLQVLGFGLYIPTDTIGEALYFRQRPAEPPRHLFDCDIGSMILMTVAEQYNLPAYLVESTLSSGSLHFYVRWEVAGNDIVNWDTNGRAECKPLTTNAAHTWEERDMSHQEVLAYVLVIRAETRNRQDNALAALDDFRQAMDDAPGRPTGFNNFAWLIATTPFAGRDGQIDAALSAAEHAVSLDRDADFLDTLACVLALKRDFRGAQSNEDEAVRLAPGNADFIARRDQFAKSVDCTRAS
jgi:hypothetical protein